jgi:hypothetical protein
MRTTTITKDTFSEISELESVKESLDIKRKFKNTEGGNSMKSTLS